MEYLKLDSIKIGSIWNEGRGANFTSEFQAELNLQPELSLSSPLTGTLQVIRLKDGVAAILKNLKTAATIKCVRCLEHFEFPIAIEVTEREYFEQIPSRDFDPHESFLINRHDLSLDLTEPLRQEIILQFPINPLCSERCAGIAYQVENSADNQYKPFANLKELLK